MSKYVVLTLCGIAISVALYWLAYGVITIIKKLKKKHNEVCYYHNDKFDPIWLRRYLSNYDNVNSYENTMLQYKVKTIKK